MDLLPCRARSDAERSGSAVRASANSKSVRETNTDVNTLVSRPMLSVTAKPRMGPVPNWKRNAAAMSDDDVRVEDGEEHAVEPGGDAPP